MPSPETSPARFYHILFLIILVVGILVRLQFTGMQRMWPDEALYAWSAKQIFLHPPMIFSKEVMGFHPPLFAAVMSLAHWIMPPETACRMTVLVANILGIAGIYLLGRRIKGPFLGVYAALILSFNFLYLNYAYMILTDGFLAVAMIYFFLMLARVTTTPPCRKDVGVGLAASSIILIKWPGVLIIPFLTAYYILTFTSAPLSLRLKKLAIPLAMTLVTTGLLLTINRIILGHWLPDTSALGGLYQVKPVWYYLQNLRNIFIVPSLTIFFAVGLWRIVRPEHRALWAQALWVIIFLTAISLTKEKDLRYTLPVFGSMILISGLGVEEAIRVIFKDEKQRFRAEVAALVLLTAFLGWTFQKVPWIMRNVGAEFTGFREAGRFIKDESAFDSHPVVIAASPRIVRYYTDLNFAEFGGPLMALPKTQQELKSLVDRTSGPVFLELDYWEKTNAHWDLPLPPETLAFLERDLGFKLVNIVEKEHRVAPGRMQREPVVAVFRRDF